MCSLSRPCIPALLSFRVMVEIKLATEIKTRHSTGNYKVCALSRDAIDADSLTLTVTLTPTHPHCQSQLQPNPKP